MASVLISTPMQNATHKLSRRSPVRPTAQEKGGRMVMEPRISLITLEVADIAVATAFYERIGFVRSGEGHAEVSLFQMGGGLVLALRRRRHVAAGAGPDVRAVTGRMTLAHSTRSALQVDRLVAAFVAAGGRLLRTPERTVWGYSGYVADPDGHAWEIAHQPFWKVDEAGGITVDSVPED